MALSSLVCSFKVVCGHIFVFYCTRICSLMSLKYHIVDSPLVFILWLPVTIVEKLLEGI